MTHTISFRGSLGSVSTWGLSPESVATIVQPASGVVLAKDVPISGEGNFSAALDGHTVGQLIAALARLGRSSAEVALEVEVRGAEGTTRRGTSTWTPTADPVAVSFRLVPSADLDYEVYGVIEGGDVRAGATVTVLVPGSPSFISVGQGALLEGGSYRVEYSTSGSPSGPDSPVLLRVTQDQSVVHESVSLCSVPAAFEYNATVGNTPVRPSLFAKVAAGTLPAGGLSLSGAELDAVACGLETETDNVRRYYLAEELGRTRFEKILPEVLFGVAHGAGVTQESEFLAIDPRALANHWSRAVSLGVAENQKVDALSGLANLIIDAHLDADTKSSLGEMVEALSLTSVTSREFLGQLLYEFSGSRQEYLAEFQQKAPAEEAQAVRFAFDLSPLLGDDALVLRLLQNRDAVVSTPEDIAGFSTAQWESQLRDLGRDEATLGAVAEAYAASLEQAYPTHAAVYRLEAQGLFLGASAYVRANPSLDIINDRVQEFVARDSTTVASPDAIEQLETVQRLVRIVPSVGASQSVQEVVAADYTSAFAIAKTPWERFRASFSASGPDEKFRSIYVGARRVAMWALHAAVTVQQSRSSAGFGILQGSDDGDGDAIDLRGLFDSLDSCACEPCRSVLSPSAYLVALLEFVQDQISPAAYSELLARRPWIAETLLDCDNAETPMSKVDLINELLEAEVNPPLASADAPQTTWSAERLTAEPEHLDRDAYAQLAAASAYPWDLPFDLNTEEIKTLLEPVRAQWGELLGAFAGTDVAAVRAAWMGMSTGALALVEAATDDQQAARWDGTFPVPSVAGGVSEFLRITQSDLEHFDRLANTWFVGRFGLAMDWAADADPCHLEDAQLRDSPTFDACMVAAERFERLRRATGWSVHELDEALQAFAGGSPDGHISAGVTAAMANLERLHRRFDTLEISQLIAWFRVPTHAREPGAEVAFERLFGEPDRFSVLGGEDTEWLEVVAGAVGTEVSVIAEVFGGGEEVASGALPLSRFWGLQGLAKALGRSLAELVAFSRLSGVAPFGTGPAEASEANITQSPAAVLEFLDLWDRWASVNASVGEVVVALDVTSGDATAEADQFFAALEAARAQVSASIEPEGTASVAERLERLLPRALAGAAEGGGAGEGEAGGEAEAEPDPEAQAAELLDALLRPVEDSLLTLAYPDWVDVAAINAALQSPIDTATLASLASTTADRVATELGLTAERLERLLPRVIGEAGTEELLDALFSRNGPEALSLSYPGWVDVAAINTALGNPVDPDALANLSVEIADRAATELGTTERAIAYARLAQQLVEGSFVFDGESGSSPPTADDDALLGRARLLRALAPLQVDGPWVKRILSEPTGWISGTMLDSSAATELPAAFAAWMEVAVVVAFDRQHDGAFGPILDAQLHEPSTPESWSGQLGAFVSMTESDVILALSDAPSRPPTAAELGRLRALQQLSEQVGASVSRMQQWATGGEGAPPSDATVSSVKEAVRSRFEPAVWFATSAASRDRLRGRQRNALISYLTTRGSARQPSRNISTVQRLSDTLLLDVLSEPCQTTSRIVEATLAVQRFVFRIQLRLEDAVPTLPDAASRHWTWMKNYRVWEAAKKIFLFPENYLESEFRAGKTPLFDDFVSTIGSGNIDTELAEQAFTAYAEGLHAVSFLRPAGIVYDYEHEDPGKKVMHVVAHDRSNPPTYYHREHVLGRWSAWEELPGSMPNTGVLPVVRRGRLSLYWPSVEPKLDPASALSKQNPPSESATITLCWTERTAEGWQAERRSAVTLNADKHVASVVDPRHFANPRVFGLHESGNGALALTAAAADRTNIRTMGSFESGGCSGQWRAAGRTDGTQVRPPKNTISRGQRFVFWSDQDLEPEEYVEAGLHFGGGLRIIRTPRVFEVVMLRRGLEPLPKLPFLFTDDRRTFLVRSAQFQPGSAEAPGTPGGHSTSLDEAVAGGAGAVVANAALAGSSPTTGQQQPPQYITGWRFEAFSHDLACDVVQALRERGVEGVFEPQLPSVLGRQVGYPGNILEGWYAPAEQVERPFPEVTFDFEPGSAYGTYNWELFFHAPAHTALQLAAQGRFEQAQKWWHYIFNPQKPLEDATSGPRRFWRVKPLVAEPRSIEDILSNLALGQEGDNDLRTRTIAALDEWVNHPFDAHAVAARRPGSYQRWVVARYLDLLIAWGDSLYRQHTRESINEAAQLYMIAAQLLGPKPERLPAQEVQARTYSQIRQQLDQSGNALVTLENAAPLPVMANALTTKVALPKSYVAFPMALSSTLGLDSAVATTTLADASDSDRDAEEGKAFFAGPPSPPELSAGETELEVPLLYTTIDDLPLGIWTNPEETREGLYFCIPPNPVFDQYWDTVGQRLFNIRNCRDLDGNLRELALFAPPIDPKLLARATASGLDVGAAISELSAPVPLYRFRVALSLAKEVAAEVKALGSAMLSALQSGDGEELAQLRARQEVRNIDQIRSIRERQIDEARASIQSLELAKRSAENRVVHYRDLFGGEVPSKGQLSLGDKRKLDSEAQQVELLSDSVRKTAIAGDLSTLAGLLGAIPSIDLGFSFGAHTTVGISGQNIASGLNAAATHLNSTASTMSTGSSLAGMKAGEIRREQDWHLQLRQAELEVTRIEQDLVAAEIRLQQAQQELDNHDFSREQSEAVEAYLTRRFTNAELHRWMANELSATYSKAYGFALDLARRAERCFQFELGKPGVTFVRSGQFVGQRKGLLAGNELTADLQRLEAEYQMANTREYELVKRVSLAELDPWSLLQLRESGQCEISIDESLFDLDHPGHFFRRVKMVRVSLPAVTGPYVSTAGRLTLLSSMIRTEGTVGSELFSAQPGGTTSIALSTGQDDSGMLEPSLRDDRYLPFEGKGAVSSWSLQLPQARSFDYESISDVVIELSYTAREGDPAFRESVEAGLAARLQARDHVGAPQSAAGPTRAWSLAAAFPEALQALRRDGEATVVLPAGAVPMLVSGEGPADVLASTVVLVGAPSAAVVALSTSPEAGLVATAEFRLPDDTPTNLRFAAAGSGPWAEQPLTLRVTANGQPTTLDDVVLVLTFGA
ncbi:MAG: neuraminidase-like domain-containing protein [Nannocystales bacterium]